MMKICVLARLFLFILAFIFFIVGAITNNMYIKGDVIFYYFLIPLVLIHLFAFLISILLVKKFSNNDIKIIVLSITIVIQLVLTYFIFILINWQFFSP
jgi:hypothetical protein